MAARASPRRAEEVIAGIRAAYLQRTAAAWRGLERGFLIELVRGLDEAAFAFTMAPNRAELLDSDADRHLILLGAASALKPFLKALRGDEGGVPWGPTSPDRAALADQHLINCGRLTLVHRAAALERYGLAEATFVRDDHLVIEVAVSGEEDEAETKAGARLIARTQEAFSARERQLFAMKPRIAAKLDRCSSPADGWFLRYDPDRRLVAYHQELARIYGAGIAEGEALPALAQVGGRPFASWNEASLTAYGSVLQHVAFATRLLARRPGLELRNLLTVFARKDDIAALWRQRGEDAGAAESLISGLSLDAEAAERCEQDYEIPLPYYIDFGRHFFLLPMFGGLMNPCAGLVWHLRRHHRPDWDRAVDGREAVFREDLRQLLAARGHVVPPHGFKLRRADNSHVTDVDAAVLDRASGDLVLVQLKWPDIHGRSLAERNSRRLNLLKANDWVEKVAGWVDGRPASRVAARLGLGAAGTEPPQLLVLARHAARFSGEAGYDVRARWLSWPGLVEAAAAAPGAGIAALLRQEPSAPPQGSAAGVTSVHRLPGLTVEIRS